MWKRLQVDSSQEQSYHHLRQLNRTQPELNHSALGKILFKSCTGKMFLLKAAYTSFANIILLK